MDFKLTRTDRFPVGTSVALYPASARREGAAPVGSAVDTQTMVADGLTFTGLEEGGRYVAYAQVNGEHRYISIMVSTPRPTFVTEEQMEALAGTAGKPGRANPYATKQTTDALAERLEAVESRGGRLLYRHEIGTTVSGNQAIIHDTGALIADGEPTGAGIEIPGPVALRIRAPMWGWSSSSEEPKSVELECQWTTDDMTWGGFEGVARLEADTGGSLRVPLNFEARARRMDGPGDIDPGIYRFKAFLWVRSGSVEPMVFAQAIDQCVFEIVTVEPLP